MSSTWSARGADYAASPLYRQGPSLAKLLALARPQARDLCLDIGLEYEGAQAVRLEMPMALILAVKPG